MTLKLAVNAELLWGNCILAMKNRQKIRPKRPETDINWNFDESDAEIEWIGRCFAHIENIKRQSLDMLIDRNDDTINLCEMKYTNAPYVITEEEDNRIRNRRETFIRETGTKKTVLITMITSYGLAPGGYSDDIQCQLTMADLFR